MTDHHIHIGQFNEVYYDAREVFDIIASLTEQTGVTKILYSSTSSCRDDVELCRIEEEIAYAQNFCPKNLTAQPYLWFVPKYAEQQISVTSAMCAFDYAGTKLHPAVQNWDMANATHQKAMHQIFRWADDGGKFVLIHCGTQDCDLPNRFEDFFREYTNARVILAHSNPVVETATMTNKYKNVFCDTAVLNKRKLKVLQNKITDKTKILFGSDFPITNYSNRLLFGKNLTLREQYLKDCEIIYNLIDI